MENTMAAVAKKTASPVNLFHVNWVAGMSIFVDCSIAVGGTAPLPFEKMGLSKDDWRKAVELSAELGKKIAPRV